MPLPVRLPLVVAALVLLGCGAAAGIDSRAPMPKFTATTIDGKTYNNAAVKGKVVLLQFWTTWCRYCRRDQDALDAVSKEFGDRKLLVLAVNAGESRKKVKQYLADSPRGVPIVLMENTNLAALFAAKAYPFYVLIDENGKIAGELRGSGGEPGLRELLRKVSLE
jgi:thiol-disulfide isomerase/thioredoxin